MVYSSKPYTLKCFEEKRDILSPYGFTCEIWYPKTMSRPDQHNEVEINYVENGSLTYFFHDRYVEIPKGTLAMFWGLLPHRLVKARGVERYYVITIPLSMFLKWGFSKNLISRLLGGEVIMDCSREKELGYPLLMRQWHQDFELNRPEFMELELRGQLLRMDFLNQSNIGKSDSDYDCTKLNNVEKIVAYIASNYDNINSVAEVGRNVGLNPDYANTIFKKVFGHTISEHIAFERITNAKKKLLLTNDTIQNIAYDCGFRSISSFNTAFRKQNGCTPKEYRNKHI